MVVVSIAFAAHFLPLEHSAVAGVVAIVMTALSFQRYRQRWKTTELSYGTAVIVHASASFGELPGTPTPESTTSA